MTERPELSLRLLMLALCDMALKGPPRQSLGEILPMLKVPELRRMAGRYPGIRFGTRKAELMEGLCAIPPSPQEYGRALARYGPALVELYGAAATQGPLPLGAERLMPLIHQGMEARLGRGLELLQQAGLAYVFTQNDIAPVYRMLAAQKDPEGGPASLASGLVARCLERPIYWVVPREMAQMYQALDPEELRQMAVIHQQMDLYAMAAANLYGILPLEDLAALARRYFADHFDRGLEGVTAEGIAFGLEVSGQVSGAYTILEAGAGRYLISEAFFREGDSGIRVNREAVDHFLARQKGKALYLPPAQEEFLRYSDPGYFEETEHTGALGQKLKKMGVCRGYREAGGRTVTAGEQLEEAVGRVHEALLTDPDPGGPLKAFLACRIRLTARQGEALAGELGEMRMHTRLWEHRGHTPAEVGEAPMIAYARPPGQGITQ